MIINRRPVQPDVAIVASKFLLIVILYSKENQNIVEIY